MELNKTCTRVHGFPYRNGESRLVPLAAAKGMTGSSTQIVLGFSYYLARNRDIAKVGVRLPSFSSRDLGKLRNVRSAGTIGGEFGYRNYNLDGSGRELLVAAAPTIPRSLLTLADLEQFLGGGAKGFLKGRDTEHDGKVHHGDKEPELRLREGLIEVGGGLCRDKDTPEQDRSGDKHMLNRVAVLADPTEPLTDLTAEEDEHQHQRAGPEGEQLVGGQFLWRFRIVLLHDRLRLDVRKPQVRTIRPDGHCTL